MISNTGSINLSSPPGCPQTARTNANILTAKNRLDQKRISTRRFAAKINISKSSVHRILRQDHGCFPYKKIKQPRLTNLQKEKRIKFANWVLNKYTKDDTEKWLFSDEKYFDLDGIFDVQNGRIWVHEKTKFPMKMTVWMVVCGQGQSVPVIFEDGTMDAPRYIDEVLPIALKCRNKNVRKQLDLSARWY